MHDPVSPLILPSDAWDTHAHVFDPARHPYVEDRDYTPGRALAEQLRGWHNASGIETAVLVQPSVYGTDNRCLVSALQSLGPRARGVAVIDPEHTSDEALADLVKAGVRGLRVNLVTSGRHGGDPFRQTAERIRGSGLFLQIYAPLTMIKAHARGIASAGVPVVLDHFAGIGSAEPDLATLDALCASAPIWIKLSADYRLSDDPAQARSRALSLAQHFAARLPDRLIWGSDWPHTGGGAARKARPVAQIEPFRSVDSVSVPRLLSEGGFDPVLLHRILCENPARLFDLPQAASVSR